MKPLVEYKGLVLKKSEASILKYLEKYREGRVWDIAKETGYSFSTMSVAMRRLREMGLVEETNKHAVYTLTKGAKERLSKIKDDEIRVVKKT